MAERSNNLVRTDAYDREAWSRAKRALAGDLGELVARGKRLLPHFDALVEDLFAALFKLVVQVVPESQAPKSTLLSRQVLRALVEAEVFAELKEETALDLSRSAQGALALARRALALLKGGEVLLEEELFTAQALARAEEDADALKDALDEAEAQDSPLADSIREKLEDAEDAKDELGEDLEKVVSELPDKFGRELTQTAERLPQELPENDERAQSFARNMGANGPSDAAARLQLAEKLRGAKKLEQLAALAGAFRAEARAARKKNRERASEELYRVGRGRDLARVLPAEMGALGDPRRRLDFLRRFVEGELQAYELRGTDRHGRGPLVVCLDGSGSMSGDRELWSKAVTLALVEIARRQNRPARALVFSGPEAPVQAFELTKKAPGGGRRPVDLNGVVSLAECFPGGGTDFQKPLQAAADAISESRYQHGDIVFITDGEANLAPAFVTEFAKLKKERDFAVYGVVVDDPRSKNVMRGAPPSRAIEELAKVADEVTTISRLTADSLRGLFEAL
ncbi:MAG: VWA domain-containing protein [Deltaproteobacteria bacterium]|nr:VWA domain-containing protein [Deltaproteobacteria bacterium]